MNVFVSDACPIKSAQDHCDVLLRKMVVEVAQLLSTAHVILDGKQVAYKPTHSQHPSAIWCRKSKGNYVWLADHFEALCAEYTLRTGKVHKTSEHLVALRKTPVSIDADELSDFVFVGPDEIRMKSLSCVHKAYRIYLKQKYNDWQTRVGKRQMPVSWGIRNQPDWY